MLTTKKSVIESLKWSMQAKGFWTVYFSDSFGYNSNDIRYCDGDYDIDNNCFRGFVGLSDFFDVFF